MSIHGFKVIVYVYGNIILPARRIYYFGETKNLDFLQLRLLGICTSPNDFWNRAWKCLRVALNQRTESLEV